MTASRMTPKVQNLTTFSKVVSRSSQAGRSLPAAESTAISCRRLPDPCPLAQPDQTNGASEVASVVDAFLTHAMREFIRGDDQASADDALDQASRGGHTPLSADDALEVDVGVEHLTRGGADGVALEQDLLEADAQDQAQAQDEQQDNHAHDAGERHVPQPLPTTRAVHDRRFVERGIDVQQRGEEDDGGVASLLPDQLCG